MSDNVESERGPWLPPRCLLSDVGGRPSSASAARESLRVLFIRVDPRCLAQRLRAVERCDLIHQCGLVFNAGQAISSTPPTQARVNVCLTQVQVAKSIGRSPKVVSTCETGARRVDVVELASVPEFIGCRSYSSSSRKPEFLGFCAKECGNGFRKMSGRPFLET